MPDIAMCQYSNCPKSNECYRFRAIPDSWQSYMEFKNICKETNNHQWFYSIDGRPVREIKLKEGEDVDCVTMNETES
jgi:hypothetical protein